MSVRHSYISLKTMAIAVVLMLLLSCIIGCKGQKHAPVNFNFIDHTHLDTSALTAIGDTPVVPGEVIALWMQDRRFDFAPPMFWLISKDKGRVFVTMGHIQYPATFKILFTYQCRDSLFGNLHIYVDSVTHSEYSRKFYVEWNSPIREIFYFDSMDSLRAGRIVKEEDGSYSYESRDRPEHRESSFWHCYLSYVAEVAAAKKADSLCLGIWTDGIFLDKLMRTEKGDSIYVLDGTLRHQGKYCYRPKLPLDEMEINDTISYIKTRGPELGQNEIRISINKDRLVIKYFYPDRTITIGLDAISYEKYYYRFHKPENY